MKNANILQPLLAVSAQTVQISGLLFSLDVNRIKMKFNKVGYQW